MPRAAKRKVTIKVRSSSRGSTRSTSRPSSRTTSASRKPSTAPSRTSEPVSTVGKIAKSVGMAVGSALGARFGGTPGTAVGGALGGAAGVKLARMFGHGDYLMNVTQNTLSHGSSPFASFGPDGKGVRIVHKEFLANVQGSTAFSIKQFPINPALAKTFPYLSQIAAQFEEYVFEGLVFEFRTTSGYVGSTPALGACIMATDYNPYNPPFATKQLMETYEFAVSGVPTGNILHTVECRRQNPSRNMFTRTGDSVPGSLMDYDYGNFCIATQGQPSVYDIGELWVTYDIRLLKPRLDQTGSSSFGKIVSLKMNSSGSGTNVLFQPTSEMWTNAVNLTSNALSNFCVFDSGVAIGFSNQPFGYDRVNGQIYFLKTGVYRVTWLWCCPTALGGEQEEPGKLGATAVICGYDSSTSRPLPGATLAANTAQAPVMNTNLPVVGSALSVVNNIPSKWHYIRNMSAVSSVSANIVGVGENNVFYDVTVTVASDWINPVPVSNYSVSGATGAIRYQTPTAGGTETTGFLDYLKLEIIPLSS